LYISGLITSVLIAKKQRVAVGLRFGDHACRDGAAGARPIFHHDGLPEQHRHALADQPGHDIGRTAGRVSHHHPDRSCRIGLCRCGIGSERSHHECGQADPSVGHD
jgi:hypothetical protein